VPLIHDIFLMLKVLSQDETPLLYSIVFGEGVVNDATSIVLFNAVQSLDISNIDALTALNLLGTFLYLFLTSTALGIAVSFCFFLFLFYFFGCFSCSTLCMSLTCKHDKVVLVRKASSYVT
jgi:sodium/hydrogen exchanger 8